MRYLFANRTIIIRSIIGPRIGNKSYRDHFLQRNPSWFRRGDDGKNNEICNWSSASMESTKGYMLLRGNPNMAFVIKINFLMIGTLRNGLQFVCRRKWKDGTLPHDKILPSLRSFYLETVRSPEIHCEPKLNLVWIRIQQRTESLGRASKLYMQGYRVFQAENSYCW